MESKDAAVIKKLAELGINVTPKELPPELVNLQKRVAEYEREFGSSLDPDILNKYLG